MSMEYDLKINIFNSIYFITKKCFVQNVNLGDRSIIKT